VLTSLTGVLEDGSNRGPAVPFNARVPLIVVQTETATVRVSALYAGGAPVPLAQVASFLMLSVRKNPDGPTVFVPRLGVLRPAVGINVVDFDLAPFDTLPSRGVQPGNYVFDVWLTRPSGAREPLIPTSPFVLEPTVNQPTDPTSAVPNTPSAPLTPDQHERLRQLIHFVSSGPARGFQSGAFRETLPSGSPFPTSVTWWESVAKAKKIVEKLIVRNPNQTPATVTWNMYGEDGVSVVESVTDTFTYAANVFEASRVRAIS
jgi:hypothetical protein